MQFGVLVHVLKKTQHQFLTDTPKTKTWLTDLKPAEA